MHHQTNIIPCEKMSQLCERAVILDAGRVVADGPTGTLLADEGANLGAIDIVIQNECGR